MQSIRSQFFIHALLAVLTIQNPLYSEVASSHLPCLSWNPAVATVFIGYSRYQLWNRIFHLWRASLNTNALLQGILRLYPILTLFYSDICEWGETAGRVFQLPSLSLSLSPAAIVAGCEHEQGWGRGHSRRKIGEIRAPLCRRARRALSGTWITLIWNSHPSCIQYSTPYL